MGPLGQEAGCVPRHCTENNLCRPPHAGARHDTPVAPTSTHCTTRHGEPNTTSVPNDGLGVSFGRRPGRRALNQKASGATCIQKLDGSWDFAIHTKYRILLRSSSMRGPRYPLPRVVLVKIATLHGA